jgi:hypothetical protein
LIQVRELIVSSLFKSTMGWVINHNSIHPMFSTICFSLLFANMWFVFTSKSLKIWMHKEHLVYSMFSI